MSRGFLSELIIKEEFMNGVLIVEGRGRLIARYPKLANADLPRFVSAIASSVKTLAWRDVAVRHDPEDPSLDLPLPTAQDALDALAVLTLVRKDLDRDERLLLDLARKQGATWPQIAEALGLGSAQGASQRRRRLEDARTQPLLLDPERASIETE